MEENNVWFLGDSNIIFNASIDMYIYVPVRWILGLLAELYWHFVPAVSKMSVHYCHLSVIRFLLKV